MESARTRSLAEQLTRGHFPDAQPWEVSEAVALLATEVGRRAPWPTRDQVRDATRVLNDNLLFKDTRQLGQAWRACRELDPVIRKRNAQALIELGALDDAQEVLTEALERPLGPGAGAQEAVERLEYEGLLGRVAKQRFVAGLGEEYLGEAIDRSLAQYRQPERPYWHGINAVALLARDRTDGTRLRVDTSVEALATGVLDQVTAAYAAKGARDPWLAATASEASLALGNCDAAELWLYRFLNHPLAQPFHVRSYDRQLREIWGGSAMAGGGGCADRLVAIIARYALRTERRWSVSSSDLRESAAASDERRAELEKNFSGESGFTVATVRGILDTCRWIGCVTDRSGARLGSGFVLDGAALKPGLEGPVFVTNAHVISPTVAIALRPDDALVTFEVESAGAGQPVFHRLEEVVFTSPPSEPGLPGEKGLDVTVARLAGLPAPSGGLPTAKRLPLVDAKAKAYVVGHPRGGGLEISLHDSLLLDIDDDECFVHYRTPTDPGSSGSAVFNKDWQVIAVHHSGSSNMRRLHGTGQYEANEAISLTAVRRGLAS